MVPIWALPLPPLLLLLLMTGANAIALDPNVARRRDQDWVRRSAIYEVFVRDFSPAGNLRGVLAGLDRIQAVGTNVVWLMPIFPVGVVNRKEPLASSYSVQDYRTINPDFGTDSDFRVLVDAIHARGMKVILDWVPNHTSWDHRWITEHPDYYVRDERGQPIVPRDPDGKSTDWTDVAQLDYGNPALRREMIGAMRYWLDQFGIDGFRLDVAGFVRDDFWTEAIPALRSSVDRPLLFLAEWGDLKMHRLGFDLTYAWDPYKRLKAVWRGGPAGEYIERELAELSGMPPGGMRLRFTTNHDETAWDNPPVAIFGGSKGARAAFVATALLPGRPLIYNGQDVESPDKLGLFVKTTVKWDQPRAKEAQAFYRRVIALATDDSAFVSGAFHAVATSTPNDVIAFARGDALVLVNPRPKPVRIRLKGMMVDRARDLLSGRVQRGEVVDLGVYGVAVLRLKSP